MRSARRAGEFGEVRRGESGRGKSSMWWGREGCFSRVDGGKRSGSWMGERANRMEEGGWRRRNEENRGVRVGEISGGRGGMVRLEFAI